MVVLRGISHLFPGESPGGDTVGVVACTMATTNGLARQVAAVSGMCDLFWGRAGKARDGRRGGQ